MNIPSEHIVAVQALGYSPEEARFLYLVATYSGYFVCRQFIAFAGVTGGKRSNQFTAKLESRGHVTWREYPHVGGVYHLFSRTLYRVMDKETHRNHHRHSTEFIRTRLALLDFVLANQDYDYLETDEDKLRYFCEDLEIPKEALPAKAYPGNLNGEPQLRYFADKFPVFLEPTADQSAPTLTLSYVDVGWAGVTRFSHHLRAYQRLLSHLKQCNFVYIASSNVNFGRAQDRFAAFVNDRLHPDISSDLARYFRLRHGWEMKNYATFNSDDLEYLNESQKRFDGPRFDALYQSWLEKAPNDQAWREQIGQSASISNLRFRTYLVSGANGGAKRAAEGR